MKEDEATSTTFAVIVRSLAPEQARVVQSRFRERSVDRGSTFYRSGEFPDSMFLVEEGRVRLYTIDHNDVTIRVVGKGEVFGIVDLFMDVRRCSATALESCTVRYISREALNDLCLAIPQLAVNLLQVWSGYTLTLIDRISSFSSTNALSRLAAELINLAAEGDQDFPGGYRLKAGVTHELLASIIGAARETVTLGLKKLKSDGAVIKQGRALIVVPDKLRKVTEEAED